jgi:C4-dicarboxylate transporter DctM subunit
MQTHIIAVLIGTFLILLVLDVPIAFCMLLASLAALLYAGVDPIIVGLETSRTLTQFYPFLAVPFFILAGDLMNRGGMSRRLVRFVNAWLGHYRTGMPFVTTVASQMFGAVSGASAATCAAIGGIMIPAQEKAGFSRAFSTALAACSGTTGALIPPSIALLIYGTLASVSIEKLFIAGILPGVLIGVGLMIVSWSHARKLEITPPPKATWPEAGWSTLGAALGFGLIAIIFVGILGGFFTATEASAVAVIYAAIVGFLIYREFRLRDLPGIFTGSARTAAALSFLIATASLFSWTLSYAKAPEALTSGLMDLADWGVGMFGDSLSPEATALLRKVIVLIVLNLSLFVVGMFVDAGPGLLIVVPVVLPISKAIGMDSGLDAVHFGVLVVSNLVIGLVTPPVGSTLFVASAIGRTSIPAMMPHLLRFVAVMVTVQLLITFVPFITTALPSLMK